MLNKEKHQLIMVRILKDIYSDIEISSSLGFKGGTAAYLFYNLSRFSVDLDFDLINNAEELEKVKKLVFRKIEVILKKYGIVKEKRIKRWTIFFLLSYGDADHNIKIEISTREHNNQYEVKEYLGITMLVAKKETLFANKLAALTGRKNIAMRDVYDIYFFAQNNWDIDERIISFWICKKLKSHLGECVKKIEKISDRMILRGLGEVLENKDKIWAKENLKKETTFLLKNYQKSLNK
ncbi:nucleotidyl transferase AbiEii/AbiGii toxin family protein [Candidatus Parcubacteria bacterium]|nr:nucleotidyl transferase AbiEii/AbiGii toxin family protein [Candidatus Parcubacteria bacterium]